ncbi:hypothetical protein [Methylobacterium sp. Leaf85]|uniref:hypothetical protein n=1 Tax=Methylobacterium sp. Leaf85 TaxID=1736241 RepID=UPI00071592B5|nr:hypothetical protein [Methylobacterium sp. Leaf85]KQO45474.1 hypothetical protein ASF08_23435 [Methylobacterium sp. Leaf85]
MPSLSDLERRFSSEGEDTHRIEAQAAPQLSAQRFSGIIIQGGILKLTGHLGSHLSEHTHCGEGHPLGNGLAKHATGSVTERDGAIIVSDASNHSMEISNQPGGFSRFRLRPSGALRFQVRGPFANIRLAR